MGMQWLERELRGTKDPRDAERADVVAAMHKARGEDIPFRKAPVSPEVSKPEPRVRGPIAKEIREALAREGLTAAYSLTGETISDQKGNGRKFWYIAPSENDILITMPSITGDVVVDPRPNKFFLPKSNNLPLADQLEMTAEYSYNLQRRIGTDAIEAIMGEAPDYSALTFAHLDATREKERFFGQKFGFNYARTQTPTLGGSVADVGGFLADVGLSVDGWRRGLGSGDVHAVPLVVALSGTK